MHKPMLPSITPPSKALILLADLECGLVNVAQDLQDQGVHVTKVAFCFADYYYALNGIPCVPFDAPRKEFEDWLRQYIAIHQIDTLIVYNEVRPYNEVGWALAQELGIQCLVFELGLLRPNWMSIYSTQFHPLRDIPKVWAETHPQLPQHSTVRLAEPCARPDSRWKLFLMGLHVLMNRLYTKTTRRFTHHEDKRDARLRYHFPALIRSSIRFYQRDFESKVYDPLFAGEWSGKYYLCPLQVHYDAQITEKSNFNSIRDFILLVTKSFMEHAPADTKLIFKMHPINRGYRDYTPFIAELNQKYNTDRLYCVDRIHLPTALEHAIASIMVNSSVGLSSALHGTCTLTLGKAIFDLEGITYDGTLDEVWTNPRPPRPEAVRKLIAFLQETTQGQGVLYQRTLQVSSHTKVIYPPLFAPLFSLASSTEASHS